MRRSLLISSIVIAAFTVVAFSIPQGDLYGSDGHGISWTVALQSAKEVKVIVNTKDVAKNRYLVEALCTVRFLDKSGGGLGEQKYKFPVPVRPGGERTATFGYEYQGVNTVKGLSMKYKLAVLGGKADEATVAEVIEGEVPARE